MSLDYAILGFLNYRPYSGYDLKNRGHDFPPRRRSGLCRYSQGISVVQALAQGLGGRIRAALERLDVELAKSLVQG